MMQKLPGMTHLTETDRNRPTRVSGDLANHPGDNESGVGYREFRVAHQSLHVLRVVRRRQTPTQRGLDIASLVAAGRQS